MERKELMMKVNGMTCQGCAKAVTRTIHRLDPEADVTVDLAHGRVTIATNAQSLAIAEAITKAGYEAQAMTG
jgi:copper chaperone